MDEIKTQTIYTEVPVNERLPEIGVDVFVNMEWQSGKQIKAGLKKVKEDDCDWRTSDDNSEISYSLTVKTWLEKYENKIILTLEELNEIKKKVAGEAFEAGETFGLMPYGTCMD